MENDIPRDSEEDRSVGGELDENTQEQVQGAILLFGEPEIDLWTPPEDHYIPKSESENQFFISSTTSASENEYPEYGIEDVEEDEDGKSAQGGDEPGEFPWNNDSDDNRLSPVTYWGIYQDPDGNGNDAPTVPLPIHTGEKRECCNRSSETANSRAK